VQKFEFPAARLDQRKQYCLKYRDTPDCRFELRVYPPQMAFFLMKKRKKLRIKKWFLENCSAAASNDAFYKTEGKTWKKFSGSVKILD